MTRKEKGMSSHVQSSFWFLDFLTDKMKTNYLTFLGKASIVIIKTCNLQDVLVSRQDDKLTSFQVEVKYSVTTVVQV